MGITVYYSALLLLPLIVYVIWKTLNSSNWPVVGMLPLLLENSDRIHDFVTDAVKEMGGTVEFKGPWFADLDMLVTSDPANINHILTNNFYNYPKGPQFRKIFDLLGDGVFSVDSELWKLHRKTILSFMNHSHFPTLLETIVRRKLENGLLPVLDFYAQHGAHFDLQEIFHRFSFDIITQLLLNKDPCTLSINSPCYDPIHQAFRDAVDATFFRHVLPESCWRLQRWLGIGSEKKLTQACHLIDQFLYSTLQEVTTSKYNDAKENYCMLNSYTTASYEGMNSSSSSLQFLKDSLFNLFFAGRDTISVSLTWLFWLLAQNPRAEEKIRHEIQVKLVNVKDDDRFFKVKECKELVYLHGALCECLRLFPPVPLNHKVAKDTDVLPSGHRVKRNTRVILSFYSLGRMNAIWGEDCMEFKPERWISQSGGIKKVPAYKFPAFNAGPRTCLGREMSFVVMKMVATAVLSRYHVQLIEDHPVFPSDSIILYAKHGLKVKLITKSK